MTGIVFFFAAIISSLTFSGEIIRLSAPVSETTDYEIFGALPSASKPQMTLAEVVRKAKKYDGDIVRITTHVSKVCQRKGCFFIAVEGDIWARVIFKGYSFFLPTDSAGKQAMLEGILTRRVLDDGLAKHYANDLETAYSKVDDQAEYVFTASSVLLVK